MTKSRGAWAISLSSSFSKNHEDIKKFCQLPASSYLDYAYFAVEIRTS